MMETTTRKYRLTFTEMVLGTLPGRSLYEKYILPKAPVPDDAETISELDTVPDDEENGKQIVTRFHRDMDGLYLIDYQIKGFLKEAANNLKEHLSNAKTKKAGIKNLRSKVDNYLFVFPRYIWLASDPDGEYCRPLRAQTAQGPRVTIAVSEYVNPGRSIEISLDLFPGTEISWTTVEEMLDYGKYKGIGQFRNGSYGRFTWELVA